ncbi:MAG: FAD-dependent oxidoreductase [Desulfovibrionaceae bacterium]|nr:FAD-dependent oxidoreductase [Desulfovibrionaceae bacterium]
MKKTYGALVVGAGVGGIRAALDLAETGQSVALIDKKPNIGGILTQLDYQFPNDHCGMCKMLPLTERDGSSQFCMRKGLFHRNIDIMLSTEVTALEGEPGKFMVTLRKRSAFVDPNKCIGCGKCSEVCPVKVKSDFNAGLTKRSAIYLPVPHNIPNHYVVDLDNCLRCWQCYNACPTGAIDFKFEERQGFHILVADSDPKTFEDMKDWLQDQNFPLRHVFDGDAAVDALADQSRQVRILFLDMGLPGSDPEKVLRRGLELNPDLHVVLMAQPDQEQAARELAGQGAKDVLLKPFEPKRFVPWLDKLYMRMMSDETLDLDVGAVILAGGFECYDPGEVGDVLGYGREPAVVTSVEFERMCSGTGPSNAKLIRPGDNKPIKKIAWLQCVGSRDLKKKADYCSSVCCMISIKEALLAKKLTKGEAETTIFYMDMRTFGKEYERYRQNAEANDGVKFVNARIHSVVPADQTSGSKDIKVLYLDEAGRLQEEVFDLLVLAVGARPPAGTKELAEALGIETNEWGYCKTRYFTPSRTSAYGIFAAGSYNGPKDIAETLIQSGAAALEASRIITIYAPLTERTPEPQPEYRDVSRETPKILIALCTSCPILEQTVDMDSLLARLGGLASVAQVAKIGSACTKPGWEEIEALADKHSPNRILIGACQPYAYIPKLRELGQTIGLNPALMDVVDIFTPTAARQGEDKGAVEREVFSALSMASVRLLGADPTPLPPATQVTRKALVVGGGLAGMTAAMGIADHGYAVSLVEEQETLGGQAMNIRYTLNDEDPVKFMEDLIDSVQKHPNITVYKDARVVLSSGRAGRFTSVIATDQGAVSFDHGATVLATGGREANVYDYGFRVHKCVMTQRELEDQLASGALDTSALSGVAMIQCWRSRDEGRSYCSRVCCGQALKNLLMLKKRNPELPVYVFYRDIMTYGFAETYYTQARRAGAVFIRYDLKDKPKVEFEDKVPVITARDPILQREIQVRPSLLVLSGGIEPNEVSDLQEMFGVEVNADGFFQEAEYKWRPVDFLKQGLFMCGLARAPGNMSETIASAKAAAQRAVRILSEMRLTSGSVIAEVRHSLCSLCGKCISVCPYGARSLDLEQDMILVDELLCQGCGACAAVCPNSASLLRGFRDQQVLSVIDAALNGLNYGRARAAETETATQTEGGES